jgi:hypothetical protein
LARILEEKRGYGTVEIITRVYHGMGSEMTDADFQAYHERFVSWWKRYEPNWRAKAELREEIGALAEAAKPEPGKRGKPQHP